MLMGNGPEHLDRPYRAVAPNDLKAKLLEKGYFLKNRFWQYDDKLLIMVETPVTS